MEYCNIEFIYCDIASYGNNGGNNEIYCGDRCKNVK